MKSNVLYNILGLNVKVLVPMLFFFIKISNFGVSKSNKTRTDILVIKGE